MNNLNHWKLGVHLTFKTRRFGVNNGAFAKFTSIFGVGCWRFFINLLLVYPIIKNYQSVRWRMGYSVGFISKDEYTKFFSKVLK